LRRFWALRGDLIWQLGTYKGNWKIATLNEDSRLEHVSSAVNSTPMFSSRNDPLYQSRIYFFSNQRLLAPPRRGAALRRSCLASVPNIEDKRISYLLPPKLRNSFGAPLRRFAVSLHRRAVSLHRRAVSFSLRGDEIWRWGTYEGNCKRNVK